MTAQLNAISCSSSDCLAVGSGVITGDSPLAIAVAVVRGAFGATFEVKAPEGSSGIATLLYGVSCTAPTTCTAVGLCGPGSTYLATAWAASDVNGTWRAPAAVQTPLAGAISVLNGVWCRDTGGLTPSLVPNCVAVGSYQDGSSQDAPMYVDQGAGTWGTATKLGTPQGDGAAAPKAVACSPGGVCTAVGGAAHDGIVAQSTDG